MICPLIAVWLQLADRLVSPRAMLYAKLGAGVLVGAAGGTAVNVAVGGAGLRVLVGAAGGSAVDVAVTGACVSVALGWVVLVLVAVAVTVGVAVSVEVGVNVG